MSPPGQPASRTLSRLFWTGYARVYDAAWDSPLTAQVGRRVAAHLPTGELTVDLGCGTGLVASVLGGAGHRVLAVDASASMMGRARSTGRVRSGVIARADRTGLADGCASAVVAVNLLHVVEDPATVLDEAVRLCAPGARVVLVWPTDEVSPSVLARVEAGLGWDRAHRVRAAAARASVSLPGQVLRVRRHPSARMRRLVHEAGARHGLLLRTEETFRGCQHLCVLEISGSGPTQPG